MNLIESSNCFCGEDQQGHSRSFVFESPDGSRYWTPNVTSADKPAIGMVFANWSRYKKVERIPDEYVSRRWMKGVLPKTVYSIANMYASDNSDMSAKRNDVLDLVAQCMDRLRGYPDGFVTFAQQIREMKVEVF
ncbi:hypothetical protein L1987_60948 [Smallanthus sonchifolius]|uniref:Uncharacterized protein n=1 Tax=Smallanthus sonchifolius TaxID=185202 RepID=A0ACB9D9H5_9ASTR|nr:hypothetical protein L1987_60948 [Smallanthus sonchifolius]